MSFLGRFRKNRTQPDDPWPQPPAADTMCLLLLDRVLDDADRMAVHLKSIFGSQAVSEVDHDHPHVPAFTVTIDGLEFWCSYLPMPVPADAADIPASAQHSFLLSDEEKEAFLTHKSFWMLAQKGGGTSLEAKRRVCWTCSILCAACLEQEEAIGVSVAGTGLLVGKNHYFQQRKLMEDKKPANDEGYFPVPLWVWAYGSYQDKAPVIRTTGLKNFGLPELGFYHPKQFNVKELLDFLYSMSSFQITGRQLYRNASLIPLNETTEVVCKQDGDILFFLGA